MTDISIIVGGVETALPSLGALVGHTGWGMPPVDVYTTRAPGQHGDTWGGYALSPRFAALVFKLKQTELDAMYTLRAQLMALFSPLYPKIIVKFVTLEGTRYFDCHLPGGMAMDWNVQDWAAQGVAVPLMCNDSTCYDPAGLSWTFALGGGADSFVVPYAVPYTMGASVINQSQIITYPGTWGTFPLIRITGPITDAKITNSGTSDRAGQRIQIAGRHALKAGAACQDLLNGAVLRLSVACLLVTFWGRRVCGPVSRKLRHVILLYA